MAGLTDVAIKDGYGKLLALVASNLSGTVSVVEDGLGNDSIFQLGTDKALFAGDLYFNDVGGEKISSDGSNLTLTAGTDIILDSATDIQFDTAGGNVELPLPKPFRLYVWGSIVCC